MKYDLFMNHFMFHINFINTLLCNLKCLSVVALCISLDEIQNLDCEIISLHFC
jgi:hypothetical protein